MNRKDKVKRMEKYCHSIQKRYGCSKKNCRCWAICWETGYDLGDMTDEHLDRCYNAVFQDDNDNVLRTALFTELFLEDN